VKCPKCSYLGFETGDRCKNCGYDFSLLPASDAGAADYEIHQPARDDLPIHVADEFDRRSGEDDADVADPWIGADRDDPLGGKADVVPTSRDEIDAIDDSLTLSLTPEAPFVDDADDRMHLRLDEHELDAPAAVDVSYHSSRPELPHPSAVVRFAGPSSASGAADALPLFRPSDDEDDEPLVKLPATPRPPLAVRRTPDTPRLRAVPRPASSRPAPAPVLQFSEEFTERAVEEPKTSPAMTRGSISGQPSTAGARLIAIAIDCAILAGIDLAVLYFTLRMAGLETAEWPLVPLAPMLTFLALLKVSYFYAFTAVGGQTIGKMAVGTCVVGVDGSPVDAAGAIRRTAAGALSFLLLGLGFVPALFGDHRALHDRLAGTRVIRLRSV
jgi:uncharacterized RDD family membrane protein YckC